MKSGWKSTVFLVREQPSSGQHDIHSLFYHVPWIQIDGCWSPTVYQQRPVSIDDKEIRWIWRKTDSSWEIYFKNWGYCRQLYSEIWYQNLIPIKISAFRPLMISRKMFPTCYCKIQNLQTALAPWCKIITRCKQFPPMGRHILCKSTT